MGDGRKNRLLSIVKPRIGDGDDGYDDDDDDDDDLGDRKGDWQTARGGGPQGAERQVGDGDDDAGGEVGCTDSLLFGRTQLANEKVCPSVANSEKQNAPPEAGCFVALGALNPLRNRSGRD